MDEGGHGFTLIELSANLGKQPSGFGEMKQKSSSGGSQRCFLVINSAYPKRQVGCFPITQSP